MKDDFHCNVVSIGWAHTKNKHLVIYRFVSDCCPPSTYIFSEFFHWSLTIPWLPRFQLNDLEWYWNNQLAPYPNKHPNCTVCSILGIYYTSYFFLWHYLRNLETSLRNQPTGQLLYTPSYIWIRYRYGNSSLRYTYMNRHHQNTHLWMLAHKIALPRASMYALNIPTRRYCSRCGVWCYI